MKKFILSAMAIIGVIGAYLFFWPVAIDPASWDAPQDIGYVGDFAPNTELANLERLSIGDQHGPEDVVMYEGMIYVSSQSGKILEIDPATNTHREYADTHHVPAPP